MRGSKKNGERPEQVRKDKRRSAKLEPLRPQAEHLDKLRDELAKFISECPYPVLRIHKDGTVLFANKAGELLLNAKGSGIGMPAPRECRRPTEEILASGREGDQETEHNGRIFGFRAVPLVDSDYVNFYGMDITEWKIAEQERDRILNLSHDLICVAGADGFFKYVNPAWTRILGYSRDELLSRPFLDFIHPDDHSKNNAEVQKLKRGKTTTDFENRYIAKDGAIHHIFWTATPLPSEGVWYCIGRNITERKRAEEALRESAEFSMNLIDSMRDGFSVLDANAVHLDVNPAFCRMTGLSKEELVGAGPPHPYWPPEKYAEIEKAFQKTLRGDFEHLELTFMRKNGERFPVIVSPSWVQDKQGNVISYFATVKDITEQKQAEESLRKSEEHYRMLADTMNDGLGEIDESGRYVYANRKLGEILGFSSDEMIGRHWSEFYDRDAQEIIEAQLIARREGLSEPYEFATTRKDGRKIHIRVSPQAIFDAHGKFKGSLAIFTDITERKLAQEQLQEERNLLRTLIDHIPDKVYVKDKDSRFVVCNKTLSEYWSVQGEDNLIGKTDFDLFEPTMAQQFFDEEQKVMQTGQPLTNLDREYSDKTGNVHYVLTTKVPLRDSHGSVIGLLGIHRDITERKLAEVRLVHERNLL